MLQLVCRLRPEKKKNYRLTHTLIRAVHDSQKAFPSLIRVQQGVLWPDLSKQGFQMQITQVTEKPDPQKL